MASCGGSFLRRSLPAREPSPAIDETEQAA